MALSLYEINSLIANYEMQFDEDGVWENESELDELNIAREEKIESICLWIKNLRAEASAIKEEEENLAERRKAKEAKADKLEAYVASNLDGQRFETARVKVSWRKSESVEILNEDAVPERLMDISVVRKPMKSEIKKELKRAEAEGREVPWARLNEKQNMSLK